MAHLTEQDREDLVAYLDGELDEESARQLEAKLSIDAEARAEAEALQQTWGLLDYLPRPEPSASFTHRTLERLAVHTTGMRRGWPRWRLGVGWAAAFVLALAAGLAAAGLFWPPRLIDDPEFLRALDHPDLFGDDAEPPPEEAGAALARQKQVLARYREWRDQLDAADWARIKEASQRDPRLQVIRELRDKEWLERQPAKAREQLAKLEGEARATRIHDLRHDERKRRQEWQIALRFWEDVLADKLLPTRLGDLQPDDKVYVFVTEYLTPQLSPEEKDRLEKAEGHWPLFPRTLVELADRHPMALYNTEHGPMWFKDLPKEVQKILRQLPTKKAKKEGPIPREIEEAQGSWPTFAFAVAKNAKSRKVPAFPNELWPNNEQGLSEPAKEFLEKRLKPILTAAERDALENARLRGWPDFPRVLNELAAHHRLKVPWQALPDPQNIWGWSKYRLKGAT